MATWQVQQAKSRFSELLDRAETEGPQTITRHGAEKAVVISVEEYRRLSDAPRKDFTRHLLGFPKSDDFEVERDKEPPRDVEFRWDEDEEVG